MKNLLLFLAVGLTPFGVFATPAQVGYVYTEKASLWDVPGYSWRDCDHLRSVTNAGFPIPDDKKATAAACNRLGYPEAGQKLILKQNPDGKLIYQDKMVNIGGEPVSTRFYQVETDIDGRRVTGWVAEDQMTMPEIGTTDPDPDPTEIEPPPPVQKTECTTCQRRDLPTSNSEISIQMSGNAIERAATNQVTDMGQVKSNAEIDRFMCLYRDRGLSDMRAFQDKMKKFKQAAESAEKAFQIPYALTMCTLLVESGLRRISAQEARKADPYMGYGQFGSPVIEDLVKEKRTEPYKTMWENFIKEQPHARFTDNAIRKNDDPVHATAAVALMMRWLYNERIRAPYCYKNRQGNRVCNPACQECSTGFDNSAGTALNKRDVFLMVAGYNYTPYGVGRFSNKTMWALQNSFPPPAETRNYMLATERCMAQGQETKFRPNDNYNAAGVSREYLERSEQCKDFRVTR